MAEKFLKRQISFAKSITGNVCPKLLWFFLWNIYEVLKILEKSLGELNYLLTDSFHSSAHGKPHHGMGILQSPKKVLRTALQVPGNWASSGHRDVIHHLTRDTCYLAFFASRLWRAWVCMLSFFGGYPSERVSWRRYRADKYWKPRH